MKPRVYIETSVISYLASEPSRDLIVAAHQQITRDWWRDDREQYELFASELVVSEAGAGDRAAAEKRLGMLKGLELLALTRDVREFAASLVAANVIPRKAVEDSLHVAAAIVHGMDSLLTWNCAHIANARVVDRVARIADDLGYSCPYVCTPEQLREPRP